MSNSQPSQIIPFSGEDPRCPKCLEAPTTTQFCVWGGVEYLRRISDCGYVWNEYPADSPENGAQSDVEDGDDPRIGTLLVLLGWVADNPDIWEYCPIPLKIGLQKNFPRFDWPEASGGDADSPDLTESQRAMYKGWMEGHGMAFGGPKDV